jgi:hypothetical protein
LDLDVEVCTCVEFARVELASWMGSEVRSVGVDVEELLLLPKGIMAPTAGLILVGTVGTGAIAGCMVIEAEVGGAVVAALMLFAPPRSPADEGW